MLSSGEADSSELLDTIQESRFSNGLFCPKCGCTTNIVKNGKYLNKQRFFAKTAILHLLAPKIPYFIGLTNLLKLGSSTLNVWHLVTP